MISFGIFFSVENGLPGALRTSRKVSENDDEEDRDRLEQAPDDDGDHDLMTDGGAVRSMINSCCESFFSASP